MSGFYLRLPLVFLKFWFLEAPRELFGFFGSLNTAFLELFSLPLLVKTYFKPWKNEYRQGLVGFSIGMGMAIKTLVIIADIVLLLGILLFELIFSLSFIFWPVATLFLFNRLPLFFISLLGILIIFFIFRRKPSIDVSALQKSTIELIKNFLKRPDVLFFLQKARLAKEEIQFIEVPKSGKTPLDFFAHYLLSIEEQTKLLFKKNLKQEDVLNILYWAKTVFPQNLTKPFRVSFWGEGIGESWTTGWTLETKKYMVDLTSEILNKKPYLLGRQNEYRQLVEALLQNKSVILVGEPGSGKNAMIESLSFESFSGADEGARLLDRRGDLKGSLYHQRIFKLYVDTLLAGAENQGELEERLDAVIGEISHSGNVIIYISDFENILGSSSFKIDLSGVLIPYLQNKSIRIIGTATSGSYKKFIQPLSSLLDVFEIIKLDEPDKETCLEMLLDKAIEIEKRMKVVISYRGVLAALNYSGKYLMDRILPGRAVVLLEDAANEVGVLNKKEVGEEDVIKRVEEKTKITLRAPTEEEKNLILNLEEKMHERLIDQEEAVEAVASGIRRIRSGLHVLSRPISFLFLGPTGVGKTQTAKTLAKLYFSQEEKMIRFDMSEYSNQESVERFIGESWGGTLEGITGKIHENPSSLILLDEFEKANPKIHNLFLQVLDDGRLTDANGKTVSFANAIIVATSNAGSEFIREELEKGTVIDKAFKDKFLGFLLSKNIFKPELLNRFDDIVIFKPLTKENVEKIVKLLLQELVNNLKEKDIAVSYDKKIVEKVAKEGFDGEFGARPIKRFIQDNIEDLIAKKILKDEIKRGNKVLFSTDDANTITVSVS